MAFSRPAPTPRFFASTTTSEYARSLLTPIVPVILMLPAPCQPTSGLVTTSLSSPMLSLPVIFSNLYGNHSGVAEQSRRLRSARTKSAFGGEPSDCFLSDGSRSSRSRSNRPSPMCSWPTSFRTFGGSSLKMSGAGRRSRAWARILSPTESSAGREWARPESSAD